MPVLNDDIRQQVTFASLDELVSQESDARVIDALLDKADLEELGFEMKGKSLTGRPAYMVVRMAKLYVYGYLHGIRSSHKLAKACCTNLEIKWLIHRNSPCQKTISSFRASNTIAIGNLLVWFNRLLTDFGLFNSDTFGIDGALIHAQNSRQKCYTEKRIERRLAEIVEEVHEHMTELKRNDARYQKNLQRLTKYTKLKQQLAASPDNQICTTDPDARLLTKGTGSVLGYNLQSSVDSENKLIASIQVTNKGDSNALHTMAEKTKEITGHKAIIVLADKGYDTGVELMKCTLNGIETMVSPKKPRSKKSPDQITTADFHYHKEFDVYVCPAGKQLKTNGKEYTMNSHKHGRTPYQFHIYELPISQCQDCPLRDNCMPAKAIESKRRRTIQRSEYQDYKDANAERVQDNKELYKKRKAIVEHPFGTIKRGWGYHFTLLRGIEKVQAEFDLIAFSYNLRRTMSIFGNKGLLEQIKALLSIKFWLFSLRSLTISVRTK